MAVELEQAARIYTPIKAARGLELSCKGWAQEAALRMLMNNLDEEVARASARSGGLWRHGAGSAQLGLL